MNVLIKGQVAWISETQQLPAKSSGKARFYGEKLHCGRFYDQLEGDYVIYVHIDVNLDGRGYRFAAARPSIVRKESGGALAWNRDHLPFKLGFRLTMQQPNREAKHGPKCIDVTQLHSNDTSIAEVKAIIRVWSLRNTLISPKGAFSIPFYC